MKDKPAGIQCVVVEDEPVAARGLLEYISRVEFLDLHAVFEDPIAAMAFLNDNKTDLLLLDIEMPELSGIDLLLSLKNIPAVIFTTAYSNYAVKGFDLDAVDFLLKPIAFERFLKAVTKVHNMIKGDSVAAGSIEHADHFFVKENGVYIKLLYQDILFVEALQNYVSIQLKDRKLLVYMTLSLLATQLPASMFMRIHKSYIVSLPKIGSVAGSMVLVDRFSINVSRNCREELLQKLLEKKLLKR